MNVSKFRYPRMRGGHDSDNVIPKESMHMHIHTELEIIYLYQGHLTFQVEGSVYSMEPGDLILFRLSEIHSIISYADTPVYERATFHIRPELLQETLNGRLLKPFIDRPLGIFNHYKAADLPGDLIRACLHQIFIDRESNNEMQKLSYLLPVLQTIYDTYCESFSVTASDVVSPASEMIAYISNHLYDLEGTQQLAEEFFLSISQINRIFNAVTGTSAWSYVKLKRLYAAKEMLQAGKAPTVVAANCGYQDYSSFFRAYKKKFGHSPQTDHRPRQKKRH